MPQTEIFLTDDLLDGAQFLCLHDAAFAELGCFFPGSSDEYCHELHQRRARFNQAREKMKTGIISLLEFGLHAEDCSWAMLQADRVKRPENWRLCFKQAEKVLQRR